MKNYLQFIPKIWLLVATINLILPLMILSQNNTNRPVSEAKVLKVGTKNRPFQC